MTNDKKIISFELPSEGFNGTMKARDFSITLDEPEDAGGTNQGMMPTEALQGALAGCIAMTIRMYAQRKNWDTGEIKVEIYKTKDDKNDTVFHKTIHIENKANLTAKQMERIIDISSKCPVGKIIQSVNPIILD